MLWLKPLTRYSYVFDKFFTKGAQAVSDLGSICTTAVQRRKHATVNDRRDTLPYLLAARDPDTNLPLEDDELTIEALSIFIGGSDTTTNTISHAMDLLSRHPADLLRLQQELDETFPLPLPEDFAADFQSINCLPFLEAVVFETLRLRPTIPFGLPRVVPPGPGVTMGGTYFKPGTILSISSYSVHRNRRVYGEDAYEFRPDRWLDSTRRSELDKHFMSFSYGPRAYIGRNIALMELKKVLQLYSAGFTIYWSTQSGKRTSERGSI